MWLMKSEPAAYSWERLLVEQRTSWEGVRNHQAAANLKAMRVGDEAFFYHSNQGLEIVGVVKVVTQAYPDSSDPTGRFVTVDVVPLYPLVRPVTLREIKQDPLLSNMALVRQSRLSVSPVAAAEWARILVLGGVGGVSS